MKTPKIQHECSSCGHIESRWSGKCPRCGEFNTLVEKTVAAPSKAGGVMGFSASGARRTSATLTSEKLTSRTAPPPRSATGLSELDRALGGGLVEGSAVMIGGDPGIGKSTLLLQMAAFMSNHRSVTYVSGEESVHQIQMRAQRLGVEQAPVNLTPSNDCLAVADFIETLSPGSVVIVDSVQVMNAGLDSAPGSTSQVKAAASHLIPAAKSANVSLVLVSHVTKDGVLAGPKLLEHAVDATIYLEADSAAGIYRLARASKNRFGPANEVGVFEMTDEGMVDVDNPSEVFLSQRDGTAFGTVIYPSLEGSRPLLLEVQALVAPTAHGTGRRSATGWDANRMNMLLATMGARLGLSLVDQDIYVNVAGGLKITDPAMDLAVAVAILSSLSQQPVPADLVAFGEIGLAGEVRNSSRAEARIREAAQLGMKSVICPSLRDQKPGPGAIECAQIKRLAQVLKELPILSDAYSRAQDQAA